MVEIEDLSPAFLTFWEQAQGRDIAEQIHLWHTRYEAPYHDIFALYYRRWGNPAKVPEALQRFADRVPHIQAAVPMVKQRLSHIPLELCPLVNVRDWAPPFVLLVGCFASDAWATGFRGRPTCFLALEQLADGLNGLDITLAHEAAHGFHAWCSDLVLETTTVGEGLFMEGLAVLVSGMICPGASKFSYFWPTVERTPDGQTPTEWLSECSDGWMELRSRVLHDLDRTDEACFASYFWTRASTRQVGIPVCAGYFVGYRVVQALGAVYPIAEMIRWPINRAVKEVRLALEQLTHEDMSNA